MTIEHKHFYYGDFWLCTTCDGTGKVWDFLEIGWETIKTKEKCEHCHGTGYEASIESMHIPHKSLAVSLEELEREPKYRQQALERYLLDLRRRQNNKAMRGERPFIYDAD
ncbi:MAG: hypothetical protein ACRDBG_07835 [Waterburya sp.]